MTRLLTSLSIMGLLFHQCAFAGSADLCEGVFPKSLPKWAVAKPMTAQYLGKEIQFTAITQEWENFSLKRLTFKTLSEAFSENQGVTKKMYVGFEPMNYHSYVVFQEFRKGGSFSKYFPMISKKNIYTTSSVFEQGFIIEIKLNDQEYQRLSDEFKKPQITKAKTCADASCAIMRVGLDNETARYMDPAKLMDDLINRTQENPTKYRLFKYGSMDFNTVAETFKKQKNSIYYLYGSSLAASVYSGFLLYVVGNSFGLWW